LVGGTDEDFEYVVLRLTSIARLRRHAIASSLFRPVSLKRAIQALGFVQADPIRSPARAQDLILRHRVKNYHAGDLEKLYPKLDIEEDFLYAYGFMPRSTWRLLHPRLDQGLEASERRVFELVQEHERMHPRTLEAHLGRKRQVNAWGGYSAATTKTLEALHYRGLLRVARRENGIRVYELARTQEEHIEPNERLNNLVLLIATILAPLPERSLRAALQHLAKAAPALEGRRSVVSRLLKTGKLTGGEVDGISFVWPAGPLLSRAAEPEVRFLAPFDPLVWDRTRFEHFWGWAYRFEAYTPAAKRKMGYYAMPVLWSDAMVGWVNVSMNGANLEVDSGFVDKRPEGLDFKHGFDKEVSRMKTFLRASAKRR
jgi:uncharacterized protein YcaQ